VRGTVCQGRPVATVLDGAPPVISGAGGAKPRRARGPSARSGSRSRLTRWTRTFRPYLAAAPIAFCASVKASSSEGDLVAASRKVATFAGRERVLPEPPLRHLNDPAALRGLVLCLSRRYILRCRLKCGPCRTARKQPYQNIPARTDFRGISKQASHWNAFPLGGRGQRAKEPRGDQRRRPKVWWMRVP